MIVVAVMVAIPFVVMMIKVEQVEQIPDGWHVPRNVYIVVVIIVANAWIG